MCSLNKRDSIQTPPGNFLIVVTYFELILRTAQNPGIVMISFDAKGHPGYFVFDIHDTRSKLTCTATHLLNRPITS